MKPNSVIWNHFYTDTLNPKYVKAKCKYCNTIVAGYKNSLIYLKTCEKSGFQTDSNSTDKLT